MEKKNMVLLTVIAVATLLVAVVGATFAYFTATVQDTRGTESGEGKTSVTAGSVASTTIVSNPETSIGKFTANDVYPGHREVAGMKVSVSNSGEQEITTNTKVNIVYDVTNNGFQDGEIEVNVFRATSDLELTENYFECSHKVTPDGEENEQHFSETCSKEVDSLTSLGQETKKLTTQPVKLSGNKEKKILVTDSIEAAGASTTTNVYYYVVVEFKDTDKSQNASMNAKLEGTVSVEAA